VLPPRLELRPSRALFVWTVTLHLLTAIVIFLVPLHAFVKVIGSGLMVASLWLYVQRDYLCQGRCSFSELRVQSLEQWQLFNSDNDVQEAQLDHYQVFRFLVILDFRLDSGKHCRVLVPEDAVDKDTHRRLRAALQTI
jgi:hypothetical protein